jgi:hypothetical protein
MYSKIKCVCKGTYCSVLYKITNVIIFSCILKHCLSLLLLNVQNVQNQDREFAPKTLTRYPPGIGYSELKQVNLYLQAKVKYGV